jgi:5-methylcytosine-specific restriction endonuclease McrA
MNEISKLCACGCGRVVKHPAARYIKGHKAVPGRVSVNDLLPTTCAFCGTAIKVHRWRVERFGIDNVFCSRQHQVAYRAASAWHPLVCEECGVTFRAKPSQKQGDHVFCSLHCAAVYRNRSTETLVTCERCGKSYRVSPSVARKNAHFYCSRECRALSILGADNPAYRSGWGRRREYAGNWRRQRRAALARDGGACRVCGKAPTKPRYLHVHHIRPAYLFDGDWESANDLSNLVTLCATCHKGVESGRIPLAS